MKAAAPKVDWHQLSLDQLERHLADLRAVNKRPTSAFWTALRKARQVPRFPASSAGSCRKGKDHEHRGSPADEGRCLCAVSDRGDRQPDSAGRHGLTYAELALVLVDVLHTWAAEAVRVEREKPQPDPAARDDWRPGP